MRKLLLLFIVFPILVLGQEISSENLNLKNGEVLVPGTLSYPQTSKKLPLLIFVHGSGNVDRNGNQGFLAKANYIAQLADSLNKKGVAFYRYDKRTSNPTNFPYLKDISFKDFVSDVSLAITHFKDDARFNGIHLIGHSQGALVALLALNKDIKSYISLAGPSQPVDKVIFNQLSKQSEELATVSKEHFKELIETDTIVTVNPNLISIFAPQNQRFFKSWIVFNPLNEIEKVKQPTLFIQGESDLQVGVQDVNALYKTSKAPKELVLIEHMNHVLKTVKNQEENVQSYTSPDFELSKELVTSISNFILKNE